MNRYSSKLHQTSSCLRNSDLPYCTSQCFVKPHPTSSTIICHTSSVFFTPDHTSACLLILCQTSSQLIVLHGSSSSIVKPTSRLKKPHQRSKTPYSSSCCIIPLSYSIFIPHTYSTSNPIKARHVIICCRTSSTYIVHHSLSHWQIVSSNFISTNNTSSNIMLPHCNILPHLAHTSWHHIKPDQTLSLKNTSSCLIKIHQTYLLSTSSSLMISHDASSHLIIPYQAKSYFINQTCRAKLHQNSLHFFKRHHDSLYISMLYLSSLISLHHKNPIMLQHTSTTLLQAAFFPR